MAARGRQTSMKHGEAIVFLAVACAGAGVLCAQQMSRPVSRSPIGGKPLVGRSYVPTRKLQFQKVGEASPVMRQPLTRAIIRPGSDQSAAAVDTIGYRTYDRDTFHTGIYGRDWKASSWSLKDIYNQYGDGAKSRYGTIR